MVFGISNNVDFEYLFPKDANLKPCIGCYNCISKGEDNAHSRIIAPR
ncbi:MAG TPA: hypothetical protein VIO11_01995 [Candidatus Methanoperedens sp.]